jgi:hypothetical protein
MEMELANEKRSHAGPMACECNHDDQPALADAICSAARSYSDQAVLIQALWQLAVGYVTKPRANSE